MNTPCFLLRVKWCVYLSSIRFLSNNENKKLRSISVRLDWFRFKPFDAQEATHGTWVARSFNFRLKKLKFDVNFWFSWSFYHRKRCQIENICLFFLLVQHCNRSYIFTLILSKMKTKMKLSNNFVSPKMLQPMTLLSFSVFNGSLKVENWKQQSIFDLFYG